uniref:Polyprotein n=1 Tax=Lagerstroemia indica cheravirus TaxID=3115784 RepID=A0AAT9JAJ6_9SECO
MFLEAVVVTGSLFLVNKLNSLLCSHLSHHYLSRTHNRHLLHFPAKVLELAQEKKLRPNFEVSFYESSPSLTWSQAEELEEMATFGDGPTLSLADVGLDHTATPTQMIEALRARKAAAEAARSATPGYGWVQGTEEIRFSMDIAPLGRYEVYTQDPILGRFLANRLLPSQRAYKQTPLIGHLEVCEGLTLTHQGFDPDGRCRPNFIALPPMNPKAPDPFRKIAEKCDGGTFDSSALDMHLTSHVGGGAPVTALISILDSRWGSDWEKALLASGEFDLGEKNSRLFTIPLLNYPIDRVLEDHASFPLYLSVTYNGLPKSWKGSPTMTVGQISFNEFYRVSFSPYTRLKSSFDEILSDRESSRIVSGLNVVKLYENDTSKTCPEESKDYRIWTRPGKAIPELISSSTCKLGMAPFSQRCSSTLQRRRKQAPRHSVDRLNNYASDIGKLNNDCCSEDTSDGNAPEVNKASDDYQDVNSTVEVTGLAEKMPIIKMSVEKPLYTCLAGSLVKEISISVEMKNMLAGSGCFAWSIQTLLEGKKNPAGQLLSVLSSAHISLRAEVSLVCPVQCVGLFKVFYDVGNSFKSSLGLSQAHHLPGPLLDGVRETNCILKFSPPVLAHTSSLRGSGPLGQLVVASLIKPKVAATETMTVSVRFFVDKIDTWCDRALGNSFSFTDSFQTGPHNLYIGDPILDKFIDTSSAIYSQWRMPIIPGMGIRQSGVWYPNCSTAFLESYRGWKGTCIFRYYFSSPPLSRGKFLLVALPPGKFDTNKLEVDRLLNNLGSQDSFPTASIDLQQNHHGFLEVNFASWLGFFPCGAQGALLADHHFCPWLALVQTSNLVVLDKTFNNFNLFIELVEIRNCILDGPSMVPPTRLDLPKIKPYAEGNSHFSTDWLYSGILTKWPRGKKLWLSVPVSPREHFLPKDGTSYKELSYARANPEILYHRAQSAVMWRGTICYKMVCNKPLFSRGGYSATSFEEFKHSFLEFSSGTTNLLKGCSAVFSNDSAFEHSIEVQIPTSEFMKFFFCGLEVTDRKKRMYSYNGWLHFLIPAFEDGMEIFFYRKVLGDFEFGGLFPPSQVIISDEKAKPLVYSG